MPIALPVGFQISVQNDLASAVSPCCSTTRLERMCWIFGGVPDGNDAAKVWLSVSNSFWIAARTA